MHVTSLPSEYGIGVFGDCSNKFIDTLAEMNFKAWQVLPFNITDSVNSPYCSPSAFAGNCLLINPKDMVKKGLISGTESNENIYHGTPYTCDFDFAKEKRMATLRLAFSRLTEMQKQEIAEFESSNKWLSDFALFMAIKEENEGKAWWEWSQELADYKTAVKLQNQFKDHIDFWKFTQWIFYSQWAETKSYAKSKGIAIIGDMPIYVAMDSVDVWSNMGQFLIDPYTRKAKKVAGVPPDCFSENGQLWGNPIYDWSEMEKDGFSWWISRIEHALKVYDTVRVDHFRAFASYWAVPANSDTAKVGEWLEGPKMKLFSKVFEKIEKPSIIAEDLGVFGEDVVKLLEDSKLPGMRVIQFGFDSDGDSSHLPHNYPFNSVAYVGTHDNNTILGWLWESNDNEKCFALDYCGFEGDNWGEGGYYSKSCRKVIESVWKSSSNTAIVAFQDMCGFGSDARMNIPGVPEKNWRYRTNQETIDQVDKKYFKRINRLYRRTYSSFE